MSDCVAIAPELPFRQQVAESLQHASRSMPSAEQLAAREMMTTFDHQLKPADGSEPSTETKREIIGKVIDSFVATKGALDSTKEGEAESVHLLLHYVLATNFDTSSAEYAKFVQRLLDAVRAGGEAAAAEGRVAKVEAASRILNNTYNFLPADSPLRPRVLLTLVQQLGASDDLSTLPLSSETLSSALTQWSVSDKEKVEFLTEAASVYEKAGDLDVALTLSLQALQLSVEPKIAERALALALAQSNRFDLDDLLKVQGARDALTGKAAELVALFTETDELEAVPKATSWASSNGSYVSGLGVNGLDADEVLRKVRLIALTTLAARSTTKEIAYADLAKALGINEDEVEAWVIDAIRANLLQARLSQPLSVVRIISVSSRGTRRFGAEEWKLLERRLTEWKTAVTDARAVVGDAETLAAQGPITNQRRPQQQRQQRQEEEVAA